MDVEAEERVDSKANESSVNAECPICLTDQSTDNLLQTKCEHQFCRSCIAELLNGALAATCPVCRRGITAFDTTRVSTGLSLMERPTTVFGGVYVQSNTVGLASYHFSEEESYISYSTAPPSWRLDNGTPPPIKKPFLNSFYDGSSRTFRAVVDWSDVNFHGDAEWIYRMVFSEDFTCIERGEVISYDARGVKGNWHAYQQDLFYVRLQEIDFSQ